jgi:hypothetical protein
MPGNYLPSSVAAAVGLMYAGAASAVLNAIVGSAAVYSVVHNKLEELPNVNQNAVNVGATFDATLTIVSGLVGTGLWLWMAHANRNGRSWARILSTVLFVVLTLGLVLSLSSIPVPAARATALTQWALALAALVLLWVGPSSAYFAVMRRPANPYPPPYPPWAEHRPPQQGSAGGRQGAALFGQLRQPGKW